MLMFNKWTDFFKQNSPTKWTCFDFIAKKPHNTVYADRVKSLKLKDASLDVYYMK